MPQLSEKNDVCLSHIANYNMEEFNDDKVQKN